MENIQIAKTFEEVADLLEIQGANPFRVRAYRNAARTIGTLGTPVETILKNDGHVLEELPGIGADLAPNSRRRTKHVASASIGPRQAGLSTSARTRSCIHRR
ncbi:MAG: hypothetical protein HYX76_02685 [Acidobacteria bacterium]|nr:hypothetical protein [Acidobacteriota bacterium]